MKVNLNSLRSRVSRRIFLLFILAAFVPITIISVISYEHINRQMREDKEREMHEESRALGLGVYDRLLTLEVVLSGVGYIRDSGQDDPDTRSGEILRQMFRDIVIYREGKIITRMLGNDVKIPELDAGMRRHLETGNTGLFIDRGGTGAQIVMAKYIDESDSGPAHRDLVVAVPRGKYLWNFGVYDPDIACALTKKDIIIACTSPVDASDLKTAGNARQERSTLKTWDYEGKQYVLYIWDLFLGAEFHSEDIGIMVTGPQHSSLADINSFNSIFPKSLVITGLLVVALSISQIRKYLNPLEQLMRGTERISGGDYNKPVRIESNDEFEVLGESFNAMALKINDQINSLRMMADIDRMILSSLDIGEIASVVIDNCRRIFNIDYVCVMGLNNDAPFVCTIWYNSAIGSRDKNTEQLTFDADEFMEKFSGVEYARLDEGSAPGYLQPLVASGCRHFIVLPLMVNEKAYGALCLGNGHGLVLDDTMFQQLRELGDRVAVALSNAAWEDKLYYQAHYDALTGLPNRYLFKDRLDQAVAWSLRANGNIALLLIDLDRFKNVNDSLGHSAGDRLLVQVASRLSGCVRASDTLSRFGGDEFTIILIGDSGKSDIYTDASRLANRLQNLFEKPFSVENREIFVSPSIGIATCPDDSSSIEDLFKYADNAMYQAKGGGAGQFCFYDASKNKNMIMKLDLEADLRRSLERKELYLKYQPKIDGKGERISGAEALLRWNHPKWGDIPSSEFIPVAEETGLILEIGKWVLQTACSQIVKWRQKGFPEIPVAVNLSGEQFRRPGFENTVAEMLEKTGLPASSLELEITESITIENINRTTEFLHKFNKLGICISIDDFGTGYSSMSYLQQFEIDRIKIDKSFIQRVPHNRQSASIVKAMITMARGLDLAITAEGVETREQYEYLKEIGIDEFQGYYFSYPLVSDEFEAFCRTYRPADMESGDVVEND